MDEPHDTFGSSRGGTDSDPGLASDDVRRLADQILALVNRMVQQKRFDEALRCLDSLAPILTDEGLEALRAQGRAAQLARGSRR